MEGEARKYRCSVCVAVGLCWFGCGLAWGEGSAARAGGPAPVHEETLSRSPNFSAKCKHLPQKRMSWSRAWGMSHVVPPWRSLGGLEELWVWWLEGRQVTFFCFHFSTCTEKARQRSGCPLPSPGLISSSGKWRYWQYLPPRMPVRTGWGKCVISPSQHRAVRTQQAPAVVWPPLFLLLLWISFKWFRTDR